MYNLSEINSFPTHDGGALTLLRDLARKYCPEEVREVRQSVFPDEDLHLEELEAGFRQLLAGGSGYADLPYLGDPVSGRQPAGATEGMGTPKAVPKDNGFGIGIPETEKLRSLNYNEVDTLNSEQIKKDFPVLNQKVNGHDLVWLDNGATTQKPIQVIDKISDYYKTRASTSWHRHTVGSS